MHGLFGRRNPTPETTATEVYQTMSRGEQIFVLDVREPSEYREAHVAGSTLVPLGQLAHRINELPKDLPIVAICRSGNRSGVAVSMLQRAGFTQARNMSGGIIAWARSGLPLKRGA